LLECQEIFYYYRKITTCLRKQFVKTTLFLHFLGIRELLLEKQGLLSIKDLWVRIHYPATAR